MLTVGLNARAGAFFILPLLIFWLGYYTNVNKPRQFNWPMVTCIILGIMSGFLYNKTLILLYGEPFGGGEAHSNFAYTLFGLVSGGKGWAYAYKLYPSIMGLETSAAQFLYKRSLEIFLQNPFLLVIGLLKSLFGALKSSITFFLLQPPTSKILKTLIRTVGSIILIFYVIRLKQLHKQYPTQIGFINVGLIAMMLSASIIWTDGGVRVFAVTVPFFAASFGIIVSSLFSHNFCIQETRLSEIKPTIFLCLLILLSALVGPKLLSKTLNPSQLASFSCSPNDQALVIRNISNIPHLILKPPAAKFRHSINNSVIEDKKLFLTITDPPVLTTPLALGLVYNLLTKEPVYIMLPPELFKGNQEIMGLCGVPVKGAENIVQIKSFEVLHEK